jgi:hypothetical protein
MEVCVMTKLKIKRTNVIITPVGDLSANDIFTLKGLLYIKTDIGSIGSTRSRVIDIVAGVEKQILHTEPVTYHPHITITVE